MIGCALILSAIPGFFVASWFVMIFWGAFLYPTIFGFTISYWSATLITITMWLGVIPLVATSYKNILSKS